MHPVWQAVANQFTPLIPKLIRTNSPRFIILAYHGVTDQKRTLSLGYGLQLWHEVFEHQCAVISQHFKSTHADEFFVKMPDDPAQIYVLMSFDDIYENVLSTAVPILEKYHLRFILFPSTRFASGASLFWWDKLRFALLTSAYTTVEIEGQRFSLHTCSARENSMFQKLF